MELKQIQLSDSLEGIARVGAVFLRNVSNGPVSLDLRKRAEALATELRQTIGDRSLSDLASVQRNRTLFHRLGVDPTKDRPSSEELLRRVLRDHDLPKVNILVDAVRFASLAVQCPLSVYDWDRLTPPVLVRIGRSQESYVTSSNRRVDLEGRLVLVDGECLFGNPSHDSERAFVTLGTVRSLIVAWAPASTSNEDLEAILREVIEVTTEYTDATVAEWGIVG